MIAYYGLNASCRLEIATTPFMLFLKGEGFKPPQYADLTSNEFIENAGPLVGEKHQQRPQSFDKLRMTVRLIVLS